MKNSSGLFDSHESIEAANDPGDLHRPARYAADDDFADGEPADSGEEFLSDGLRFLGAAVVAALVAGGVLLAIVV
jgi:hypothetical protein